MDTCYFIYTLRVKGTKLFYIGVTINIDKRISQHIADITGIAMKFRFNKMAVIENRKPVHIRMAKEILKGKRKFTVDKKYIKSRLTFQLNGLAQGEKAAANFEDRLLKTRIKNKNCLNAQFKSAYSYRRLPQPKPEMSA